jgi:hypothetical protein
VHGKESVDGGERKKEKKGVGGSKSKIIIATHSLWNLHHLHTAAHVGIITHQSGKPVMTGSYLP